MQPISSWALHARAIGQPLGLMSFQPLVHGFLELCAQASDQTLVGTALLAQEVQVHLLAPDEGVQGLQTGMAAASLP